MKKIYVYAVSAILAITGLSYLIAPAQFTSINFNSIDASLINMIRSSGGLYLGVAALILFLIRKEYIQECVLGIAIIMLGFIFGRVTSIFIDGMPNSKIIVSLIIEIIIACTGFTMYRSTKNIKSIDKQK